ncbi:MAG: inositol monophosphatase [Spirochaetes bacterium]|nr:inositol monophosphatase [Spirochaetota bacterium]
MDYAAITEDAIEVCKQAGAIILEGYYRNDVKIDYKSKTNLVTNIDYESEQFIVESINKKFPDHAIVAEEGSLKKTNGNYVWFVDPLDATNNFAHKIPLFCVTIALYSRQLKTTVVGVVYEPLRDECFYAWKGGGAYLNTKRIFVSQIGDIGISVIATGFPYKKDDPQVNNLKQFNNVLPHVQGIRRMGSAAIDLSYVACGRFDGYWEPMLYPWDMAAGALIVEEAGGKVTKYNGDTFDPEYPEICATNGLIHQQLLECINR